jgi:hypothetical protein
METLARCDQLLLTSIAKSKVDDQPVKALPKVPEKWDYTKQISDATIRYSEDERTSERCVNA